MLEHIDTFKPWNALNLPSSIAGLVHRNRLIKIAHDGCQMTFADLTKFKP
ncbi:TPA: hypothetical protein ACID8E_002151 [Pseudomonas aeruginosa]|jgi:hypothetical protein|nr:hypothetical protein [Pseudomonas aeruginosa]MDP5933316.1 hypothetical protein [Pseudomonas aeruginosa]MDY0073897.1 hypothetical protein [Thauera sp.]WJO56633.1 hypothetical protein JTL46_23770 [Pseudomonas aeruginosa]WJO81634.1 hypothetical protein JTM03_25595 [Pseudomonas aeruginosa]